MSNPLGSNGNPSNISNDKGKGTVANKVKNTHHRRSYSCGPCKHHKTKCDHAIPCYSCQRYRRESLCLQEPATPPVPKQPRMKRLRIIESTPGKLTGKSNTKKISQAPSSTSVSLISNNAKVTASPIPSSPNNFDHVPTMTDFQKESLNVLVSSRNGLKPIIESPEVQQIPQSPSNIFTSQQNMDSRQYVGIAAPDQQQLSLPFIPGQHQKTLAAFDPSSNQIQEQHAVLPGQSDFKPIHKLTTNNVGVNGNVHFPLSGLQNQNHMQSRFPSSSSALGPFTNSPLILNPTPSPSAVAGPSFHSPKMDSLSQGQTTMNVSPDQQYQHSITPDGKTSFHMTNNAIQEKDDHILALKNRVGELEELVSKLSGIASFSYVNTSARAAENADSVIAYQGPIHDVWNITSSELNWRIILLRALPSREQCKVYVDYYFEYVDYIYHPLHNATFLLELETFWTKDSNTVDIIWVSILFMIISLSSLHLPKDIAKKLNVNESIFSLSQSSALWFRASRQALQAGGYDEKPTFQQLQTFSLTQLYLYATNQIELLNSLLAQAVRHCHVLGLHSDTPGADCIETELRRRMWWDICGCDTFQSLCMDRPVLVNSYFSNVPFPQNCHEADMTLTEITSRPRDEPTIMSFQIERNVVMKTLNQLFTRVDGSHPSYQEVLKTDQEMREYVQTMPWFFQVSPGGALAKGFNNEKFPNMEYIYFQAHMLHTCLCMHRVRIHQPFLQQKSLPSLSICLVSVKDMFSVYSQLRRQFGGVGSNYNFIPQIHQSFSAAVAQGMFLLVEKPNEQDAAILKRDVDTFIEDLKTLTKSFFVTIPILTDGIQAISRIRDMVSAGSNAEKSSKVVSGVYSVFGGKKVTEKYLKRCAIDFLVNASENVQDNTLQTNSTLTSLPMQYETENMEGLFPPFPLDNGMPSINYNPEDPNRNDCTGSSMWNFPSQNTIEESFRYVQLNGNLNDLGKIDLMRWDNFGGINTVEQS